jgi:hypothetical protein
MPGSDQHAADRAPQFAESPQRPSTVNDGPDNASRDVEGGPMAAEPYHVKRLAVFDVLRGTKPDPSYVRGWAGEIAR